MKGGPYRDCEQEFSAEWGPTLSQANSRRKKGPGRNLRRAGERRRGNFGITGYEEKKGAKPRKTSNNFDRKGPNSLRQEPRVHPRSMGKRGRRDLEGKAANFPRKQSVFAEPARERVVSGVEKGEEGDSSARSRRGKTLKRTAEKEEKKGNLTAQVRFPRHYPAKEKRRERPPMRRKVQGEKSRFSGRGEKRKGACAQQKACKTFICARGGGKAHQR